jgi:hypothetical protein
MTVYVQVVGIEKVCAVVNAGSVEVPKCLGSDDLVIKGQDGEIMGQFNLSRIAGWWSAK